MTTNYERIKQMSADEMAEFSSVFQRCEFYSLSKNGYTELDKCRKTTCKEAIKQWLESEAEDDR